MGASGPWNRLGWSSVAVLTLLALAPSGLGATEGDACRDRSEGSVREYWSGLMRSFSPTEECDQISGLLERAWSAYCTEGEVEWSFAWVFAKVCMDDPKAGDYCRDIEAAAGIRQDAGISPSRTSASSKEVSLEAAKSLSISKERIYYAPASLREINLVRDPGCSMGALEPDGYRLPPLCESKVVPLVTALCLGDSHCERAVCGALKVDEE